MAERTLRRYSCVSAGAPEMNSGAPEMNSLVLKFNILFISKSIKVLFVVKCVINEILNFNTEIFCKQCAG